MQLIDATRHYVKMKKSLGNKRNELSDNFKHVFERMLDGLFIDRMEGNEEIFDRIMQDASFRDVASAHLMREIYDRLRAGAKAERNAK